MVSLWALDAMKTTLSVESRTALDRAGQATLSTYSTGIVMVAMLSCVFLAIAVLGLKLKDKRT
jgi:hypothetical protein